MDCKNLIHPFQHDPGVSQRQRIIDDLLSGPAKIDARTLADLLDFFVRLSRHINHYDSNLSVNDWQPFFEKSLPFTITAIAKYDIDIINEKIDFYQILFNKYPSPSGMQLLLHYLYYNVINRINKWSVQLKESGLPIDFILEKHIKDKLQNPIRLFVSYANTAVKMFCIKPLNFTPLYENEIWGIDFADLYASGAPGLANIHSKRKRAEALYGLIKNLAPSFLDIIRLVSDTASLSLEQSLTPLKDELREKHQPHLAILFSFLKLFQYLQNDLNSYTKKHLDFFYQQVLKLKSRDAVPDKLHIVFEIQKQLKNYRLEKGVLVKDGKDNNKAEILYSLDDEIVVNKTLIADKRTLFLNHKTNFETVYLEGVYMAPNVDKADGKDKDFKDDELKSFATLGAKKSKYVDPEHEYIQPYPNARLGFILASPVLLLNEGKRTINFTIPCKLKSNYCNEITRVFNVADPCCDDAGLNNNRNIAGGEINLKSACDFYVLVKDALAETYYYVSQPLIQEAIKLGVGKELVNKLEDTLTVVTTKDEGDICYCSVEEALFERIIPDADFNFTQLEKEILSKIIKPRRALSILFSGENEWIEPSSIDSITIEPATLNCLPDPAVTYNFTLKISVVIEADKPSVTFYDHEQLKEDFNTTMPLVKIELDDKIKILSGLANPGQDNCCLSKSPESDKQAVSLYHFFRNVFIVEDANHPEIIDVEVCGLKNLIVQNDESVQDVNSPVVAFGARPKVGSSFYIGNKELFGKNWKQFWINATWKDRPIDLQEHYKHYDYEPYEDGSNQISEASFKVRSALLQEGQWKEDGQRRLFKEPGVTTAPFCNHPALTFNQDVYRYPDGIFLNQTYNPKSLTSSDLPSLNVNSREGFLRLTLEGVSFQHDRYSFVVARHMMALADLVDPISIMAAQVLVINAGKILTAIVVRTTNIQTLTTNISNSISDIIDDLSTPVTGIQALLGDLGAALAVADIPTAIGIVGQIGVLIGQIITTSGNINTDIGGINDLLNDNPIGPIDVDNLAGVGLFRLINELGLILTELEDKLKVNIPLKTGLPNEPYTPTIKSLSIDYLASAEIDDIDFIHLYPYESTYKKEEIKLQPSLLPTFCDEGTLFLGLKELVPGSVVNILFQLAEATADSELGKEEISWSYLENNQWKSLRKGFELLEDHSNGLTTSGIVKLALPANMTNDNTVLPKGLHWIKAAITKNSLSICETIEIHTQAVSVTFTNGESNDKQRLKETLPAGSVSKLKVADASVKKVNQPYDSFGGRIPEGEGGFYVRVSELLRHKGRAIQKFDYERLALEAFPELYKVKCINHSFALNAHQYINDFPIAPGYVLLAVIPDLNQLKAANSFEPKAPINILEKLEDFLRQKTSPFVRLRVMNPRYERVHFCIKIKLYLGKDENYYKEKLKQDLREFLAPWAIGLYDKMSFGQCVNRSDIVRFLETRDYLDYILDLRMKHEDDPNEPAAHQQICPLTPRSILIAGSIDICILQQDCESFSECTDNDRRECCDHEIVPVNTYCK